MEQTIEVLTIKAASELSGLGEPAIRQTLRECRIPSVAVVCLGDRTARLIALSDAIEAWPAVAGKEDEIDTMRLYAPVIVAADGVRFRLLDAAPPFLHTIFI